MTFFTYGSLMFSEVWARVTGAQHVSALAVLRGYQARKVRGQVYPGLLRTVDSDVTHGVAYFDVGPVERARLDEFEGDFYDREEVQIEIEGVVHTAWVYVVASAWLGELESTLWDAADFGQKHAATFGRPRSEA